MVSLIFREGKNYSDVDFLDLPVVDYLPDQPSL